MTDKLTFSRTAKAAQSDRLTKWDLIAAIAEDAVEAGVPIGGAASVVAAKAALDAAGNEYADATVKHLCVIALFDHESTPKQRKIWRRYGWTCVRAVAQAGWSPEAAAVLLGGDRKTQREIRATVTAPSTFEGTGAATFDERCSEALTRLYKVLRDFAALTVEAEELGSIGGHSQMALGLYRAINERVLDAELRNLLDEAGDAK